MGDTPGMMKIPEQGRLLRIFIGEMVAEGLVTMEKVRVIKYRANGG